MLTLTNPRRQKQGGARAIDLHSGRDLMDTFVFFANQLFARAVAATFQLPGPA